MSGDEERSEIESSETIISKQFNPQIVDQTTSSITIIWELIPDAEVYKVEKYHKTGEWTTEYWGSKPPGKVDNLEENFGYKLRIVAMKFVDTKGYHPIFVSDVFIGCTLLSLPTTIALYRSIRKGEQFLVKRLLQKRPELVNLPSPNCYTPLANAIALGQNDIIDVLLTLGANVHEGNLINKRTPLHIAFYYGHISVSRILLNKKADINAQDAIQMTPAHYAVEADQLEVLKFALESKCDTEITDFCGWTLLQRAIVTRSNLNLIKLLIHNGCKVNVTDKNGHNCVQLAKINGNPDLINFIEHQMDIKTKESKFSKNIKALSLFIKKV